jgi:hypothetical protein
MTTYWRWDDAELMRVYGHTDRDRIADQELARLQEGYHFVEPFYPEPPPVLQAS